MARLGWWEGIRFMFMASEGVSELRSYQGGSVIDAVSGEAKTVVSGWCFVVIDWCSVLCTEYTSGVLGLVVCIDSGDNLPGN